MESRKESTPTTNELSEVSILETRLQMQEARIRELEDENKKLVARIAELTQEDTDEWDGK